MVSSERIGLIAVIAISGCSIMFLVLGRQKLRELKKDSSCLQTKVNQKGGLGSHTCEDHQHQQQHGEGGASISWELNLSRLSPDKKQNLVKKVRFSEDVVEPSGDNVAYRRRHALGLNPGQPRSRKPDNTCCQNKRIDYSKSDAKQSRVQTNIQALYIGICNDRSRRGLIH